MADGRKDDDARSIADESSEEKHEAEAEARKKIQSDD